MTLDRGHPRVEMVARAFRFRVRRAAAFAALALALGMPRAASAEPAFGDPDWVAPGWERAAVDTAAGGPTSPGPRVAKPDKDPAGETVLRAPFRLAFLPLRGIARGAEWLIGKSDAAIAPAVGHAKKPAFKIEPTFNTDPGIGLRITRRLDPQGESKIFVNGVYAWHDRRNVKLMYRSASDNSALGLHFEGQYKYRPNTTFYGIGNFSSRSDKSFWLREEGRADAWFHLGRPVRHEFRLLGSLSQVGALRGFNGPAGALPTEDFYAPGTLPGRNQSTRVWSFGFAGDLAHLDEVRTPHRGAHAKASAEWFHGADDSGLDYRVYHVEGRGYVPVFSERRVLAFRALHHWIDPSQDSSPIPYYRLVESNEDLRFNGYATHRFVDRHLALAQVEYRWWITNKIYAVLNANAGEVASQASRLRWADIHEAYGTGFRYGYDDRFTARFDVAKGSEGLVLNFTLEDTF